MASANVSTMPVEESKFEGESVGAGGEGSQKKLVPLSEHSLQAL